MRWTATVSTDDRRLRVGFGYHGIPGAIRLVVADYGVYNVLDLRPASELADALNIGGRDAERALRREHEAVARARRQA